MSDRGDEKREGFVPSGRRGWLRVGGTRGAEIQPVTPGWARQAKALAAAPVKTNSRRSCGKSRRRPWCAKAASGWRKACFRH